MWLLVLHVVVDSFVGKLQKSFIRNNRVKKYQASQMPSSRATSGSQAIGSRLLKHSMQGQAALAAVTHLIRVCLVHNCLLFLHSRQCEIFAIAFLWFFWKELTVFEFARGEYVKKNFENPWANQNRRTLISMEFWQRLLWLACECFIGRFLLDQGSWFSLRGCFSRWALVF